MPRRPAAITQADVARVLRAVRDAGGGVVEVRPDGTITMRVGGSDPIPRKTETTSDGKPHVAVL